MDLVVECYAITKLFPDSERYGLTSQLQRAAVSVPANIAEGQGRGHTTEFIRFLGISYGSLMEVETHIQIAERLQYTQTDRIELLLERTAEVTRMLNGLMRLLKQKR